jgi:hypothetical protein
MLSGAVCNGGRHLRIFLDLPSALAWLREGNFEWPAGSQNAILW